MTGRCHHGKRRLEDVRPGGGVSADEHVVTTTIDTGVVKAVERGLRGRKGFFRC